MDRETMNRDNGMMKADGTRELSPDEMGRISGGANFWFFDEEKRRPRGDQKPADQSNGG